MSSRRAVDVPDARAVAAIESLEPRRLLSIAPALLDDMPVGRGSMDGGPVYAARESAESWQSVPGANFSQIQPSQFTDAELRYAQPLFWFSTLANSVVENATASLPRGWINLKVWREPADNLPYNARVLENHIAFAFFYTTDRPWNPYFGNMQVRNRLEAILDLWVSMQNTSGGEFDGSWTEYSSSNWSLAPTSFGLRTMVNTLQLLANGPAINATTHQNTINATLRGLREMLKDDYWLNRGNDYSNQYSAVWGAALDFVALFPQYTSEFHGYLNARFPSAASKHQSPTGFLYEAGGPDFAYTQGTHQTNITNGWHRLRGSSYQSFVVDESQELYDWVRYNFVRQPSGAGYLTNYGATTRLAGRFFAVGNNANPVSEFVPDARFLDRTSAEEAQVLMTQRATLTSTWGNWGALANPSSNSYPPTPFNNVDLIGWRPTEQQRLDSTMSLPYLASTSFNQQMVDSRRPAHFSFIRRPSYYATLNAGQQITSFQRLGLGLMWNDQFGAAMQTQANTNSATWGTRASGQSAPYEASTINTTYTINGASSPVQSGSRRLADGNFGAAYPLGSAGSKTISFTDSGVSVNISHTGSFTEVLPLLRRSNETISLTAGRISLTRGNATFAVVFDPSVSVTRNTPGISPGDGQIIENFTLAGSGSLSYTMRFELVVPSIVSGDRAGGVQDDVFRLVRKGSVAQLMLNSDLVPDAQWDIASPPSSLQIRGLGGNDTLIIDLSGGNPLPASGLSFDGGSGAINTIVVSGGTAAETITLRSGQIQFAGGSVSYGATQSLQLNLGTGGDAIDVNGNADVTVAGLAVNVVAGGTVSMPAGRTLPTFTVLNVDGTFDLAGTAQSIDALNGSGIVRNNGTGTTLTLGAAGGGGTFVGSINNGTGALSLRKDGAGRQILAGAGNFSGAVEIFSGALRVTSDTALGGTSGGAVLKGGTNTGVLELAGGITLAEPITLEARAGDFPTHLANVSGSNTISANLRTLWGGLGYAISSDVGTLTLAGEVFYGDVQTYDRPLHLRGEGAGVINGIIRGNSGWDHNLFKTGGGTWTLLGGVAPSGAASAATADVNVAGGLLVVRDRLPRGAINIDAGTLRLAGSGAGASMISATVTALNIAGAGRLDLADQFLVVDYAGSSPIGTIESLIRTGRAGGAWDGTGVMSSNATATTGIAAADANAVESVFPATFLGQSIDASSVLLRLSPRGDANLDGVANADDLARLSASYRQNGRTFADGNFDYSADGTVGLADLAELASAYQPGPAALLEPDRPTSGNGPTPTIPIALPGAPVGLDLSTFTIQRNLAAPVSLAGSGVVLETAGGSVIALGHLQSVMSQRGFYTITLNPAGWTAGGMTLATPLVLTYHNYLVGDMNSDGQINNLDIAPFVSGLTSPAAFASTYGYAPLLPGDVNGDGQFNNLDIAPFVSLLTNGRPGPEGVPPAASRWSVRPPSLPRPAGLFGEDPLNAALR